MQNTQIKFTYSDYVLLPELDRREMIDGDFYLAPAPNIRHQVIVGSLGPPLVDHAEENDLGMVPWGPVDVVLSDENVVQPDILLCVREAKRDYH